MGNSSDPEMKVFKLSDGDVYCWVEQGSSIMLKSATKVGDPVELSAEEARSLANELLRMATESE